MLEPVCSGNHREIDVLAPADTQRIADGEVDVAGVYASIMFDALALIDRKHNWHREEYTWHLLRGPVEERVAQMLDWRAQHEEADRLVCLTGGAFYKLSRCHQCNAQASSR